MGKKNQQTKSNRILIWVSTGVVVLSIVAYLIVELLNTYSDVSNDRAKFSIILMVSTLTAFIGFVLSVASVFKVSGWQKRAFIFSIIITMILTLLQLISLAFTNSLS